MRPDPCSTATSPRKERIRSTAWPVALTAGKRLVDPPGSLSLDLEDRATVQRPVIALAQAGVLADRNAAVAEGELGRLDRAAEV